jgi:hypothetical protein
MGGWNNKSTSTRPVNIPVQAQQGWVGATIRMIQSYVCHVSDAGLRAAGCQSLVVLSVVPRVGSFMRSVPSMHCYCSLLTCHSCLRTLKYLNIGNTSARAVLLALKSRVANKRLADSCQAASMLIIRMVFVQV